MCGIAGVDRRDGTPASREEVLAELVFLDEAVEIVDAEIVDDEGK
jgi:hypothetical protein